VEHKLYLSSSPHLRAEDSTSRIMLDVSLSLLPACGAALWFFGLPALWLILLCIGGCLAFEALCRRLMGQPQSLRDNSALVTGLLLALNLPPSLPWWMALLGSAVAIGIGKQVYGGLGTNPFNPALVARVVLLISFPVQMTRWSAPQGARADLLSSATPLGELKTALMTGGTVESALAATGGALGDFFLGSMAGSMGEVSALALLAGAAYLFWRRVLTWQVPVAFLGSVVLISGLFWLYDPAHYASPLFHLLTGGMMLGALYMATDMVTSPVTGRGLIVFGLGCGLITMAIRLFGSYPEGVSFAILLMNAATPLIDRFTRPRPFGSLSGKGRD